MLEKVLLIIDIEPTERKPVIDISQIKEKQLFWGFKVLEEHKPLMAIERYKVLKEQMPVVDDERSKALKSKRNSGQGSLGMRS